MNSVKCIPQLLLHEELFKSKSFLSGGLQQFDLRMINMPAGAYFAMLNLDGKLYSKKILKVE